MVFEREMWLAGKTPMLSVGDPQFSPEFTAMDMSVSLDQMIVSPVPPKTQRHA